MQNYVRYTQIQRKFNTIQCKTKKDLRLRMQNYDDLRSTLDCT